MKQKRGAKINWQALLRIFCAAMLISLGFAHRPVSAANVASKDYFAEGYRLPDGSFSTICLEQHIEGGDAQHPHSALFNICDACILTSSLLLPVQNAADLVRLEPASLSNPWLYATRRVTSEISQRYFARGPPFNL